MKTLVTSFYGNSNIGLYIFVTDKFMLLGHEVSDNQVEELKKTFDVPIYRCTIAGTSLIGVFLAGNSENIIVPEIAFKEEIQLLKETGAKIHIYDTKLTCLGNNILVTKHKIIVNPEYTEAQAKKIGEIFGIPVQRKKIAGMNTVGNVLVINELKGVALLSNDATENEMEELEQELKLTITPTSVNMGSPFIASGIACNKNGFAIGKASGSAEIMNALEGLGFQDEQNE